jgi:hypothetical protein
VELVFWLFTLSHTHTHTHTHPHKHTHTQGRFTWISTRSTATYNFSCEVYMS